MTFADLLRAVVARLKLAAGPVGEDARNLEIALDEGQTVSLSLLDDDATCTLSGFIRFYPPAERQARLFEMLLGAHAFGLATDGASFGVDMEASKVFLFQTYPLASLDADATIAALNRFASVHRRWLKAQQDGKLDAMLEGPWPPGSAT